MSLLVAITIGAFAAGVILSALVFFCRKHHWSDDVPFDEMEDFSLFGKK